MVLAFIGMSGIGKSHWARQLAQLGYTHLDCDAMIAGRLGSIVDTQPGEEPVHAVGRWMGMPWSDGYSDRENQYLQLETDATADALDQAEELYQANRFAVIDTTGSVIYTPPELLKRLKRAACVVYFDTPDDVRDRMVDQYLAEPKPVLWRGRYTPTPGEPRPDALARCYAELLHQRTERYRQLADVTLDYHALRDADFDTDALLRLIPAQH